MQTLMPCRFISHSGFLRPELKGKAGRTLPRRALVPSGKPAVALSVALKEANCIRFKFGLGYLCRSAANPAWQIQHSHSTYAEPHRPSVGNCLDTIEVEEKHKGQPPTAAALDISEICVLNLSHSRYAVRSGRGSLPHMHLEKLYCPITRTRENDFEWIIWKMACLSMTGPPRLIIFTDGVISAGRNSAGPGTQA